MSETSANPFGGLDLLSSAVILLDENLAIRYLNPAAENLLAISSKVFVGCPMAGVIECPAPFLAALDSALNHGWDYTGQNIDLRLTAGELLRLNCTVNPVDTPQARLLVELWPID